MHELAANTWHFLLLMFVCTIIPSPLVGKGWMKQNTASPINTHSLSLSCKTTIVGGRPKEEIVDFRENRHNSSLLCTVSGRKQPRAHYTCCSSGLPADRPCYHRQKREWPCPPRAAAGFNFASNAREEVIPLSVGPYSLVVPSARESVT